MIGLRFTRQAEADILSIYDYTTETFGVAQWTAYEQKMRTAFANIEINPLLGRDLSDVKPAVRRLHFESHALYYHIDPMEIVVLRILGRRQDPGRHL